MALLHQGIAGLSFVAPFQSNLGPLLSLGCFLPLLSGRLLLESSQHHSKYHKHSESPNSSSFTCGPCASPALQLSPAPGIKMPTLFQEREFSLLASTGKQTQRSSIRHIRSLGICIDTANG